MEEQILINDYSKFFTNYKTIIESTILNYENCIQQYGKSYDIIFLKNFTSYSAGFNCLSNNYKQKLNEKEESNSIQAWDFSVFDIIKIKRIEEGLHSPMITELLNPAGSHGQKDLFYKLFIRQFLNDETAKKFINDNCRDY